MTLRSLQKLWYNILMVRIGLSIGAVLVSLLFPSRAVAARAIYAYMSPCEALGVACPDGAAPVTTTVPAVTNPGGGGGGAGTGPVYVPPPAEPLPVPQPAPAPYMPYVPEIPFATPVHSAAPLHPSGVPMEVSIALLSLAALTAMVLPAFRRKYA